MIPQKGPQFHHFGEAAQFFYEKFSESAPSRFEKYLVASGGRELEAVARYCWNVQICEALLPCLHTAELALRNAIHRAMCSKYLPAANMTFPDGCKADEEWWFTASVRGGSILRDRDMDKVQAAYEKLPKNGKPISPRVVAELPFGFWVELLNSNYDESIVVPMLGTTMKKVQTKQPQNRTRGWLRERFGEIRDLRNRVSHHEPVYHLQDLQFVYDMAWLLSDEITPGLTKVVRKCCRFNAVRQSGWKGLETDIRARVRAEIFEPFKVPRPPSAT